MSTDRRPFFDACREGNIGLAKKYYVSNKIDIWMNINETLECACEADSLNIVQWIYSFRKMSTEEDKNVFKCACLFGSLNIIEWIYSVAPWTYSCSTISTENLTAYLELLAQNSQPIVSSDIRHVMKGEHGNIDEHWILTREHRQIIFEKSPSLDLVQSIVDKNNVQVLQFLLEHGADVHAHNNKLLPIFASWENKFEVYKILLDYCTTKDYKYLDVDIIERLSNNPKSARKC